MKLRIYHALILTVLIFVSCTTGYEADNFRYDYLFNDGNSKVWLIDEHYIDGKNIIPANTRDRQVMIFHSTGTVKIGKVKNISTPSMQIGHYYVNSDKKILEIKLDRKNWILEMTAISEDSISLKASSRSDIKEDLKLIPFPER